MVKSCPNGQKLPKWSKVANIAYLYFRTRSWRKRASKIFCQLASRLASLASLPSQGFCSTFEWSEKKSVFNKNCSPAKSAHLFVKATFFRSLDHGENGRRRFFDGNFLRNDRQKDRMTEGRNPHL